MYCPRNKGCNSAASLCLFQGVNAASISINTGRVSNVEESLTGRARRAVTKMADSRTTVAYVSIQIGPPLRPAAGGPAHLIATVYPLYFKDSTLRIYL